MIYPKIVKLYLGFFTWLESKEYFYREIQKTTASSEILWNPGNFSGKLHIAIFYYMTTFIHHYEKASPTWQQQHNKSEWIDCRSFSVDEITSVFVQVYIRICVCAYVYICEYEYVYAHLYMCMYIHIYDSQIMLLTHSFKSFYPVYFVVNQIGKIVKNDIFRRFDIRLLLDYLYTTYLVNL